MSLLVTASYEDLYILGQSVGFNDCYGCGRDGCRGGCRGGRGGHRGRGGGPGGVGGRW